VLSPAYRQTTYRRLAWVANLAVSCGCRYFLPGPRLPFQFHIVTALGRYQFLTAWWTEARVRVCVKSWMTCLWLLHDCGTASNQTSDLQCKAPYCITNSVHERWLTVTQRCVAELFNSHSELFQWIHSRLHGLRNIILSTSEAFLHHSDTQPEHISRQLQAHATTRI